MANELPFTMAEYQRRLTQVRKRMAARDLDTLLVVNPASCNYLTGYVTFAVGAYQCLVVPHEGDLSLLTFELELPGVFLSSWIQDGVASPGHQEVARTAWPDARLDRDRA